MTRMVAIVGPTASGKSELAVDLARSIGGEVINTDSMQLYVGMDIGTAKLPESVWGDVPHHLLDIWPVTHTATLAQFQRLALNVVDDVQRRGRVPLLVGGSGMYVQAVIDRWSIPGTDPEIRARLETELADVGPMALHERLASLDPEAAAQILPSNGRRTVRALEVVEMQGEFTAQLPEPQPNGDVRIIGLDVPREVLDERIAARIDAMWRAGLVDEVTGLVALRLAEGVTARRALGYAQILRMLAGECTEDEAREQTVAATRRFVRKQQSWFRRDPRIQWLPYDDPDLLELARTVVLSTA